MTKTELKKEFRNRFHRESDHFFFCPGRVNLIGEHIDYNGGDVMPCAISLGTYLLASRNDDMKFRFESLNFSESATVPVEASYKKEGKEWFNYPLGVLDLLIREGAAPEGYDLLFYGDLPIGAGLSSSASIEVLTFFAFDQILGLGISKFDIALLAQRVENNFIGVNCGIMDQFAVAMGKKGKAILLNCDDLGYEYLSMDLGDYMLAIINSNKERKLSESKYNERFAECRAALALLQQELHINNLCDIGSAVFEKHLHLIHDETLGKRAAHVISENERVKLAKEALTNGKTDQFGRLMYASHKSLKDLYEVSGRELDTIVSFCEGFAGCIGARMTGAGFGGSAIALVRKNQLPEFTSGLIKYYEDRIGYACEVFASGVGEGVTAI
ncbi:MAG TPA: galactokinase [Chitinophagaceae bacterium]|nr:galactokinase [Chitinophagaceae bacterium]